MDRPGTFWKSAQLAALAGEHGLLPNAPGDSSRSRSTQIGILASRYVNERFELGGGIDALFRKSEGRKGNQYSLELEEIPPG